MSDKQVVNTVIQQLRDPKQGEKISVESLVDFSKAITRLYDADKEFPTVEAVADVLKAGVLSAEFEADLAKKLGRAGSDAINVPNAVDLRKIGRVGNLGAVGVIEFDEDTFTLKDALDYYIERSMLAKFDEVASKAAGKQGLSYDMLLPDAPTQAEGMRQAVTNYIQRQTGPWTADSLFQTVNKEINSHFKSIMSEATDIKVSKQRDGV